MWGVFVLFYVYGYTATDRSSDKFTFHNLETGCEDLHWQRGKWDHLCQKH